MGLGLQILHGRIGRHNLSPNDRLCDMSQQFGQPPPDIRIPIFERRLASFLLGPHPLENLATRVVQDGPIENCGAGPNVQGARSSQASELSPTSTGQPSIHRPFNDPPIQQPHSPTPRIQAPILERRLALVHRSLDGSQTKVLDDTRSPVQSVHNSITNSDDEVAYRQEEAREHAGIVHTNEFSDLRPYWQKLHIQSSALSPIFERKAAFNHSSSQSKSSYDSSTFVHDAHGRIAECDYEMEQDGLYETVQSQDPSEYPLFEVLPTRLSDAAHPSNAVLSPQSRAEIGVSSFEGEIASNSGDPSSFLHSFAMQPLRDTTYARDNNYATVDLSKTESLKDVRRNQPTTLLDPMVNVSDFVKKLFNSLVDPNLQSVMCWGPLGDCFWIMNVNECTNTVLPRLYKHSNFASFVRQLNKYGFRKVRNTSDDEAGVQTWCFRHPKFHARRPEDLGHIKPIVSQRNVSQPQHDTDQESSSSPFPSNSNESSVPPPKRRFSFSSRDNCGPYIQSSRSSPNSNSSGYVHKITEGRQRPASPSQVEMYADIQGLQRESDDAKVRLRSLDRTSESLRSKIDDAQMLLTEHNGVLQKMMAYCAAKPPL